MKIWKVIKSFRFGDMKAPNGEKGIDELFGCKVGDRICESDNESIVYLNGFAFQKKSNAFKEFCELEETQEETKAGTPIGELIKTADNIVYVNADHGTDDADATGSIYKPYKTLSYAMGKFDLPVNYDEYSKRIVFDVSPGSYEGDLNVPIRRSVVIRGIMVDIVGDINIQMTLDYYGSNSTTGHNAPTFAIFCENDDTIYESGLINAITVSGDIKVDNICNTAIGVAHIVLSSVDSNGGFLVSNSGGKSFTPTLHIDGCEFFGNASSIFAGVGCKIYFHVMNSKILPTLCGNVLFTVASNCRFGNIDYSIDASGNAFTGTIAGIGSEASYYNGFTNCNFQGTVCKFGGVTRYPLYFDAHSWYRVNAVTTFSLSNVTLKLPGMIEQSGITANRPANPVIGSRFYDTTLSKPIWYTGVEWKDAMGNNI